jgi:hypothetical protein
VPVDAVDKTHNWTANAYLYHIPLV